MSSFLDMLLLAVVIACGGPLAYLLCDLIIALADRHFARKELARREAISLPITLPPGVVPLSRQHEDVLDAIENCR